VVSQEEGGWVIQGAPWSLLYHSLQVPQPATQQHSGRHMMVSQHLAQCPNQEGKAWGCTSLCWQTVVNQSSRDSGLPASHSMAACFHVADEQQGNQHEQIPHDHLDLT
jgi:hypothetical protein